VSYLAAPAYELGETELDHAAIGGFAERAAELGLPNNAKLMGWGNVRVSERSLQELSIESAARTLGAAGLEASGVDALIFCSTRVPGNSDSHGLFMETLLEGIGLGDVPFYSQTMNRCTNLLNALEVADAFVRAGRYRTVLVVTADKVDDGGERTWAHALFSDSAASCLVTAEPLPGAFEMAAFASAQDASSLEWSNEISSDLSRRVNDLLLEPLGMKLGDVGALMHLNVVKPLVMLKELQAGFTPAQLYTENIPRLGHCFGGDNLINLVDREAAGHVHEGGWYILAASVPGARVGLLVRKLSPKEA
jgi:3-oxoacyl-[acyl-carrier-protein] synthase-3